MPTFRGEKVDERHLNEFVHSEVEIIGNIDSVMNLAQRYIKHMIRYLLKYNKTDIEKIAGDVSHLRKALKRDFRRISYIDALLELKKEAEEFVEDNDIEIERLVKEFLKLEKPIPEILKVLINRIEIHQDKQVDLIFNFRKLNNLFDIKKNNII